MALAETSYSMNRYANDLFYLHDKCSCRNILKINGTMHDHMNLTITEIGKKKERKKNKKKEQSLIILDCVLFASALQMYTINVSNCGAL